MPDYEPYNRKKDLDGPEGPLALIRRTLRKVAERDDLDSGHLKDLRDIVVQAQLTAGTAMVKAHEAGRAGRRLAKRWVSATSRHSGWQSAGQLRHSTVQGGIMKSEQEVSEVLAAISEADPGFEDEELEAMRNALRFVLGYEGNAADFITMYITEI